jgi:hypothetical protein
MNYSFYLFVNLRIVILGEGVEYDIQHGIDQDLFAMYEKSIYNVGELPEYECMVNFLNAYKNNEISIIMDSFSNYLSKHDWVVLLEDRSIDHDVIKPRRGDVLQFIRVNDNDSTIGEFLHLPSNQPLNIFADRTLKLNK